MTAANAASDDTITACQNLLTGSLRIAPKSGCLAGPRFLAEKTVVWSATGPQGPAGPTGATGSVGPQGPAGPAGEGTVHIYRQTTDSGTLSSNPGNHPVVEAMELPGGTYLVNGSAVISNPNVSFIAGCTLTVDGESYEATRRGAGSPIADLQIALEGVVSLDSPGTVGMSCYTGAQDSTQVYDVSVVALPATIN
jgi:hypothetical protein